MARVRDTHCEGALYRGHAGARSARSEHAVAGVAGYRERGKKRRDQDRRQAGRYGAEVGGAISAEKVALRGDGRQLIQVSDSARSKFPPSISWISGLE